MKKMQKLLALILSLVMVLSVTTLSASAATGTSTDSALSPGGKTAPPAQSSTDGDWEVPDWAANLEKTVKPYGGSFLYWGQISLDPTPEIVYDTGLDMVFLSYGLDSACKLTECFNNYRTTFLLWFNLDRLAEMNDIDASIWDKPEWREKSIGSQLSSATVAKLKAGNYDAYTAITQVIAKSAEYEQSPKLREQVAYHLSGLNYYWNDVVNGVDRLSIYLPRLDECETPAEVITAVQEILENNPELGVLEDVREVVYAGRTSKTLATFQALGTEKCDKLWAKVVNLPSDFLRDETTWLENYRVAVPFPAAKYHGLVELPYPVTSPELPIISTGG